jgi:hypothetical protein
MLSGWKIADCHDRPDSTDSVEKLWRNIQSLLSDMHSVAMPFDLSTFSADSFGKRSPVGGLAGVIFEPSLAVHAAYLLPHDAAKQLASGAYPRFPLEVALAHPACVNITLKLKKAEEAL